MEKTPNETSSIEQPRERIVNMSNLTEGSLIRYSEDGGKTYTYARCGPMKKDYTGNRDLVFVETIEKDNTFPGSGLNVGPTTLQEYIFEMADEAEIAQ